MRTMPASLSLAAYFAWLPLAGAQPLAEPLADFDRMISELKTRSVVGEPIRVGNTTVIPFTAVQFQLGSAGAAVGAAGGMGAKTVPLGVLIVEGDDVRAELFPEQREEPSVLHQLLQAILDRKVVIMGNGLNIGNASGGIQELAPLVSAMMGQTTVMGQVLNLGSLNAPRSPAADADKTIADLEIAANKNPSAEAHYRLGEALRKAGQREKAAAAYRKAIQLRPNYPEAARALAELKK